MQKEYIPSEQINLKQLKEDLRKRKQSFSLRALGDLLGITHVGLYYKLTGLRSFKKQELQLLATKLGENYAKYFKNSHSDAAS